MINDLFPVTETPPQVDSPLDLVAINVSLDLINDIPAKDPRWADIKLNGTVLRYMTVFFVFLLRYNFDNWINWGKGEKKWIMIGFSIVCWEKFRHSVIESACFVRNFKMINMEFSLN